MVHPRRNRTNTEQTSCPRSYPSKSQTLSPSQLEPLLNREARPGLTGTAMLCTMRPHPPPPHLLLLRDWSVRFMADAWITWSQKKGVTGRASLFIKGSSHSFLQWFQPNVVHRVHRAIEAEEPLLPVIALRSNNHGGNGMEKGTGVISNRCNTSGWKTVP